MLPNIGPRGKKKRLAGIDDSLSSKLWLDMRQAELQLWAAQKRGDRAKVRELRERVKRLQRQSEDLKGWR